MKKLIIITLTVANLFANGAFDAGEKSLGFILGSDNSLGENHTVVGAKVNYFIVDNLSIGASYQAFLGSKPNLNQVSVPVTYHIPIEGTTYRPYIGAFYNQTFIDEPYKDYNIYGGRVGLSLQTSINSFMSLGWVQEFSTSSDDVEKRGYPEVSAGFSF